MSIQNYFKFKILFLTLLSSFILVINNSKIGQVVASNTQEQIQPIEKFDFDKTVISIAHIVKEFDKNTTCQVQEWKELENSCKCCLVKYAPQLDFGKKPEDVLNICFNKEQCNQKEIQGILNKYKISSPNKTQNLLDLITKLYDISIIIKTVSSKDIKFNNDGSFTESSVVNFLAQAYNEHKLLDRNFKDTSCLKATNIMKEKGFNTKQLFLVRSTCSNQQQDYIFKESITGGYNEVINLQKSLVIPALAPYIYPHEVNNFPSFILPEAYVAYKYNNKEHDMALMIKASGVILSSLVKSYKNNEVTKSDVEHAFYETGLSISSFHKTLMAQFKNLATPKKLLNPTYIHGDAHQSNIFYDKDKNHVTFIDNERLQDAPKDPFIDIQYVLLMTYKLFTPENIKLDKNFMSEWLTLTIEQFLTGYIDAWHINQRKMLLEEIIDRFNAKEDYNTSHNLYDIYQLNKLAFNKAFEALRKKYS